MIDKKKTKKEELKPLILANMPYRLLSFLIRENSLRAFINNHIDYLLKYVGGSSTKSLLIISKNLMRTPNAINRSFIWQSTTDICYWKPLDSKYLQEYEKAEILAS